MRNHVHLVLQPSTDDGLTRSMMRLNSEYAQIMHFRMQVAGHFWQGRFKASVMDDNYFWTVMRYVELNPVRAGLVLAADRWMWSSAGAHLATASWPDWLAREPFCSRYCADEWRSILSLAVAPTQYGQIRQTIRQNRPMADHKLVRKWEAESKIQLLPRGRGRPRSGKNGDREYMQVFSQGA
jgi:putative transposase